MAKLKMNWHVPNKTADLLKQISLTGTELYTRDRIIVLPSYLSFTHSCPFATLTPVPLLLTSKKYTGWNSAVHQQASSPSSFGST